MVVNFSASWCTPCRVISPAFADLADKYSSMMFLTVDVDELAVSVLTKPVVIQHCLQNNEMCYS